MNRICNYCVFFLALFSGLLHADQAENSNSKDRIAHKILFISECSRDDIIFECLNNDLRNEGLCSEYGVLSCDARSVYTNIAKTWVMTSTKVGVNGSIANSNIASATASGVAASNAAAASAAAASAAAASAAAASAAAASAAAASAAAASAAAASAAAASAASMNAAPPPM